MDQNYHANQPASSGLHLDALEAFEVFSHARNFFFWILLVMLIASQAIFWGLDRHYISAEPNGQYDKDGISQPQLPQIQTELRYQSIALEVSGGDSPPPQQSSTLDNPAKNQLEQQPVTPSTRPKIVPLLASSLKSINYVASITSLTYCFCLIAGLKLVMIGGLGGLAEASRAFFLALSLLVFVLPWQFVVSPETCSILFSWPQWSFWQSRLVDSDHLTDQLCYYGRFSGLWLIGLALLLFSQWRSMKSVKAVRLNYRSSMNLMTAPTRPPLTNTSNHPVPLE